MPHDVGKYQQGGHRAVPAVEPDETGYPTHEGKVAKGQASAHPTPRAADPNPTDLQDSIKHVGANTIRK